MVVFCIYFIVCMCVYGGTVVMVVYTEERVCMYHSECYGDTGMVGACVGEV